MRVVETLRAHRIVNSYDLLLKGEPMIWYRPTGRMLPSGWMLYFRDRKVAGTPWYDNGALWFSSRFDGDAVAEAKKKAAEMCGVTEWEKSPFDNRGRYPTWIPKGSTERALRKIGAKK